MLKKCLLILLLLISGVAFAKDDNLPISLTSQQGAILFNNSKHKQAFWKLQRYFVTERGLTWCAIATDVMALNALGYTHFASPTHYPYKIITQGSFFGDKKLLKIISPAEVFKHGVSLEQNYQLLKTYGAKVSYTYGNQITVNKFRQTAIEAVSSGNEVILVNICRSEIHEKGCGHFSPLAAYNKKADSFLLMDVARYKYPPVWVKTQLIYNAISKGIVDTQSKKSRGYIVVFANS